MDWGLAVGIASLAVAALVAWDAVAAAWVELRRDPTTFDLALEPPPPTR